MEHSQIFDEQTAGADSLPVARWRWAGALVLGTILWLAAAITSEAVPKVMFRLPLEGATWALVGVLRLVLGMVAIGIGLRTARLGFKEIGLTKKRWRSDALIGTGVAVAFALVQFLVIIPNTGGAARSDIAANIAQMGGSIWGVAGFIVLAWTGSISEEIFVRGHFFNTLHGLLGRSRAGLYATAVITAVLFAMGHRYQGWVGMLDTGFYGGLILTLLYIWRGRLTSCIVAHAMWNTLAPLGVYLLY